MRKKRVACRTRMIGKGNVMTMWQGRVEVKGLYIERRKGHVEGFRKGGEQLNGKEERDNRVETGVERTLWTGKVQHRSYGYNSVENQHAALQT